MNDLLYIELLPAAERFLFSEKVREVANKLQTNPDYLMQVMKSEAGLRADIRNTYSPFYKKNAAGAKELDGYATGLIQFIPSTARAMGTTTWLLEKMSRVQQMDFVYQYLKPYTGKLKSYFDVYLVVFFPAAIGNSGNDNYVFEVKNISRSAIAKANPAIDINKDGTITMAEFKQYLKNTVNKSLWARVFDAASLAAKTISNNKGATGAILFFLALQH